MSIIFTTLRTERRKTYSPFLPVCPETEKFRDSMLNLEKKLVK